MDFFRIGAIMDRIEIAQSIKDLVNEIAAEDRRFHLV